MAPDLGLLWHILSELPVAGSKCFFAIGFPALTSIFITARQPQGHRITFGIISSIYNN